jgi:hypothetical protein
MRLAQEVITEKPEDNMNNTEPVLSSEERLLKVIEDTDLSELTDWPENHQEAARDLLREYNDVFALDDREYGCASNFEHKLHLTDETPFKERFRTIPPSQVEEVRKLIDDMLAMGTIRESNSPWCNAIVLVKKKNGSLRLCIDYRKLNARTVKDAYPLPRIEDTLNALTGARIFTSLDLKQGFWQIPMNEDSKQYTAFTVGSLGFFECEKMPFGLSNAPATFQRMMQSVMGELNLQYCLIYLDDIIIYSDSEEEHLRRMRVVLDRLRENGLKLRPSKCRFFQKSLEYLGHKISAEGVHMLTDKVDAIQDWAPPTNFTELRMFLGVCNHYRRFIQGYAKIAGPMHRLLTKENAKKTIEPVSLDQDQLEAFQKLKEACTEAPVLAFADFTKEFQLETDASEKGLGAVITQLQQDGKRRPVAFASRTLSPSERNYHPMKLEFLAVKWAITEKFKEYLMGREFHLTTDNNPLTYIMTTPNLDATGHRWASALASYPFSMSYIRGKNNVVPDALSRLRRMTADETAAWLQAGIQGVANRLENLDPELIERIQEEEREFQAKRPKYPIRPMKPTKEEMKELDNAERKHFDTNSVPLVPGDQSTGDSCQKLNRHARLTIQMPDWKALQGRDPYIAATVEWLQGRKSKELKKLLPQDDEFQKEAYNRQQKTFVLINGLLYRKYWPPSELEPMNTFVCPEQWRHRAIDGCHRDAGHQGLERTMSLVRERYWWPGQKQQIEREIKDCERCIRFRGAEESAQLRPITVSTPMELIHVDYTSVETEMDPKTRATKLVNVLVVTDHLTRFTKAFVTPDQKAVTTAKALVQGWLHDVGIPMTIISDKGRSFDNDVMDQLCEIYGIRRTMTSPYHPQTNGQVERANRTIVSMIGKLAKDEKANWPQHLSSLTMAYNCTRSAITGYSPYYLMTGRRPRLPVDFYFPSHPSPQKLRKISTYIKELKERLLAAHKDAQALSIKEAERQKRYYDQKLRAVVLKQGDLVLVAQKAKLGRRKIQDRWEDDVHEVVKTRGEDMPLYDVQNPKTGKTRTVHRNLLKMILPTRETTLEKQEKTRNLESKERDTRGEVESDLARSLLKTTKLDPEDKETCSSGSKGPDPWWSKLLHLLPRR